MNNGRTRHLPKRCLMLRQGQSHDLAAFRRSLFQQTAADQFRVLGPYRDEVTSRKVTFHLDYPRRQQAPT